MFLLAFLRLLLQLISLLLFNICYCYCMEWKVISSIGFVAVTEIEIWSLFVSWETHFICQSLNMFNCSALNRLCIITMIFVFGIIGTHKFNHYYLLRWWRSNKREKKKFNTHDRSKLNDPFNMLWLMKFGFYG